MKKNYLLLAGVLVSTFAFASVPGNSPEPSGLAVVKKNETTVNLFYQSTSLSDVRVSIVDSNGNQVFSESIKRTDGFVRPYNLEQLKEGDYYFNVEDGSGKRTEKFTYRSIEAPKAANIVKLNNGKYLLGVKGSLTSGKIKIKIYEGDKLVHEQANEITKDFGYLFTMKGAVDPIRFEVTDSRGKLIN